MRKARATSSLMMSWMPQAARSVSSAERLADAGRDRALRRGSCRAASCRRGRSRRRDSRARDWRRSASAACRPGRSRRDRASAPALRGPTRSRPRSSTSAIEPPPAPISIMSMTGMRTGRPLPWRNSCTRATSIAYFLIGSPSRTSAPFAVVPPMSNESRFGSCERAAVMGAHQGAGGGTGLERAHRKAPRRRRSSACRRSMP